MIRMSTMSAAFAAGVMSVTALGADALEEAFRNPPQDAKPHTWYHMMNGNVTKEGITRDFEALSSIGMGGVQMFDAGCEIPSGGLDFNSPEWFDMFLHAAKEARRLGLEICIPNCSGWSSSGGPWNMPSNGMKIVAFREKTASGPSRFRGDLDRDRDDHGFYEDIAVLAFPRPAAEKVKFDGVKVTLDKDGFTFASSEAFELAGFSFRLGYPFTWSAGTEATVEASDDGAVFRPIEKFPVPLACSGVGDHSLRFHGFKAPVRTRTLRVKLAHRSVAFEVKEARPEARMSLANLKAKTFEVRNETWRDTVVASPEQVVPRAAVVDLTARMKGDTLDWDVPAGEWTILRIGHKCNGRRNHPASDHGVGLEVDKLSAGAMDHHFNQYVARLVKHLGPYAGAVETGFNNILVDSYEVGTQNWTQGFDRVFEKRMGYSLRPFLPVFAGRIVGSVEESERFLEDFRRIVADLFAENYAGALTEKCHQFGLKCSIEPYGNCPADNLQYGSFVDIPMGEFWSSAGSGNFLTAVGNARFPAYIAHVWGRKIAGTESFTASPDGGGRWLTTPFTIKAQGDRAFTHGVNRIIYHRFTHQPWADDRYLPGMTMGRWGMHFDRTQTWWNFAKGWISYQSRCQAMLQEGVFVADALFYCGSQAPNQGGNSDGGGVVTMKLPAGYSWDVCPKAAFMRLKVENGQVVVPGGVRYPLLVLPVGKTMGLDELKKIDELLAAGAKVCGPVRPVLAPGLVGYPKADGEVAALSAALWDRGILRMSPADALKEIGVTCDFASRDQICGDKGVSVIHRRNATADWYFVALPNRKSTSFEMDFRVTGRVPEIWDAEKGTIADAGVWHVADGRTFVRLDLPVSGSAFVVFRRPVGADHIVSAKIGAKPFAPQVSDARIEIVKGEYGDFPGHVMDITDRLRRAMKNGVLDVILDNGLAGRDPAPMTPKIAKITYRENGKEFHKTLREFSPFSLPLCLSLCDPMPDSSVVDGKVVAAAPLTAELTYASGRKAKVRADVPAPVPVTGPWEVSFPHAFAPNPLARGADEKVAFPTLVDWTDHELDGVKYFSGTATYRRTVPVPASAKGAAGLVLDLGSVREVARVTVNGKTYPALWKPPYRVDITDQLKSGKEMLELSIEVANLWANRLIGDDITCAPDCEWKGYTKPNGVKEIGVKGIPQWVKDGKKSPTGRVTFTTWKHWDKNDPLQSSGLLGPVCLRTLVEAK